MTNPVFDAFFAPRIGQETPFLHLPGQGRVSHSAFATRAARFARVLVRAGLAPGDRLVIQVEKSPDALALYSAAIQTGIVLLPLNPAYTPAEVAYYLADSGAKLLLCDPSRIARLDPVARAAGAAISTLSAEETGTFCDHANHAEPLWDITPRDTHDIAALLYTSGTTGRAKGAMMTHGNLVSNSTTLTDLWRFTPDDVLVHALPVFHTHGLFVATNIALLSQSAMIFLPRFEPGAVLDAIPRATTLMGVPTFYTRLLDHPGLTHDAVAHMRLFVSGSAPLLPRTFLDFEKRTGHRILERYGMTETGMITSNSYTGRRRAGQVGAPLPGVEILVTDPQTGCPVPAGTPGVVEVRGPNVFAGYWRKPEKTAREKRANGFFVTGDIGKLDPAGNLEIIGRARDMIISGGLNVYPVEIEQALDALPGITESAVFGAPHPDLGEGVVAVIVAEPGAAPGLSDVRAALANTLAGFKRPRRLIRLDALPRNSMGKVQKADLRSMFSQVFQNSPGSKDAD